METTQQKPKTIYEIFESGECSRCGGTGRMPFSAWGGVCFLCCGRRMMLSAHGKKNYNAWKAAVDAVTLAPATELRVGDAVKLKDDFRRYYYVESIEVVTSHCGYAKKDESGKTITDENGNTVFFRDQVFKVRLTREITLQSPLGSYKQQEFEVGFNEQIRIYPRDGVMPQAEAFVTVKKERKPRKTA